MLAALVGQVLCCGQSNARRDDALNGRIISQVQEQAGLVHAAILLKVLQSRQCMCNMQADAGNKQSLCGSAEHRSIQMLMLAADWYPCMSSELLCRQLHVTQRYLLEVMGGLHVYSHSCKDNGKLLLALFFTILH